MKKLYVILPVILTLICLSGCGSSKKYTEGISEVSAEAVKNDTFSKTDVSDSSATLTVGFDQEFPPMGFIGQDGEYTGFDLELAEEVAERLNLEFKAQPIAWDSKDMELESGNIYNGKSNRS